MNPRLQSSTEWTSLPNEYLEKVVEVFTQTYLTQITQKNAEFRAEGRIFAAEILVRVGFHQKGQIAQDNFEISVDFDPKTQKAQDIVGLAIDAAGAWFDAFFDDATQEYPESWFEFEFGDDQIYVQHTTNNSELEAEADRLLGIESALYNDEGIAPKTPDFRGSASSIDQVH